MGEKDITEKILEDHNDVFADIINGLIFAGEQRILPESLENTAVHSQYKADEIIVMISEGREDGSFESVIRTVKWDRDVRLT